jgi:RNA polymerase II subunit A small phosphatase-like protein
MPSDTQSQAYKKAAASAPSKDSLLRTPHAADRQVPPRVHPSISSKENVGSASRSISSSSTASPALDKREASAGTSTLLPHNNSRHSFQYRSQSKDHTSFVGSSEIKLAKKSKESFFSKFFHKLISCVGLNSRAHDVDVDGVASIGSGPTLLTHKTADNDVKEFSEKAPGESSLALVVPVAPNSKPPVPPKDVLPIAETAGATSGAVQPPGSSVPGQVLKTSSSRLSEHAAEFDDVPFHELSEEDEMLIRNGGAGIPIGPVSGSMV